ncbi:MAG: hypothetical protein ABIJ56_23610 [Pseudomonadota bacterium]
MNVLKIGVAVACLLLVYACDDPADPIEAYVTYTVTFQGSSQDVLYTGIIGEGLQGFCSVVDSGDGTYPKVLSFKVQKQDNKVQLQQLKMRPSPQDELLLCTSFDLEFQTKKPANALTCGDPGTDRPTQKCEFKVVVYNEDENILDGTFSCPGFDSNQSDPDGPVEMSVTGGTFSLKYCL